MTLSACDIPHLKEVGFPAQKICNTENEMPEAPMDMDPGNEDSMNHDSEHMDMDHSGSGELPDGLENAHDPLIINSDHMEGRNGAEATIIGAYDTIVYAVTYTPATGGEPVSNHNLSQIIDIKGKDQNYFVEKTVIETNLYLAYLISADEKPETSDEVLLIEHPPAKDPSAHLLPIKINESANMSDTTKEIGEAVHNFFEKK